MTSDKWHQFGVSPQFAKRPRAAPLLFTSPVRVLLIPPPGDDPASWGSAQTRDLRLSGVESVCHSSQFAESLAVIDSVWRVNFRVERKMRGGFYSRFPCALCRFVLYRVINVPHSAYSTTANVLFWNKLNLSSFLSVPFIIEHVQCPSSVKLNMSIYPAVLNLQKC